MAWINTPRHTKSIRDEGPWQPFKDGKGAPGSGSGAPSADTPTPVAVPAVAGPAAQVASTQTASTGPSMSPMSPATGSAARPTTTRIIRTIGSRSDSADGTEEGDGPTREVTDLNLFRRYPALFHQMAARKRRFGVGKVRLSFYDVMLIAALVFALIYLVVIAFTPQPANPGWPTTRGATPSSTAAPLSPQR